MVNLLEMKRILIVDDEPQIGKIFGLKLKLAGYDVVTTSNGTEAIDLIKKQEFDIVLLDVLMPEVSGLDVLESVRGFSNVPVIIFTARTDIFEVAKRLGASDYISKPLNPEHLVEKIKTVLGEHQSGSVKPKLEPRTGADSTRILPQ
jgi:DNA-binding response OmpR family regulator